MKKTFFALIVLGITNLVAAQVTQTTTVTSPIQTETEIRTVPQKKVVITQPTKTETTTITTTPQRKVVVKKKVVYRRNGSRHVVRKKVIKPTTTMETKISAE